MATLVLGEIVADMGPISTYPITINAFFIILRGSVTGLLRPKSAPTNINTFTTPLVTIITTYILPLITIISNHITPLISTTTISYYSIFMNIFFNMTILK